MVTRILRKKAVGQKAVGYILLNLLLVLTLIMSSTLPVLASNGNVLTEIRLLLQNQYVDSVTTDVLNAQTVDEALNRLDDPHTLYLSPEEYQGFLESINMSFFGIGVHIEMEPEGVRVISVITGSPAEEVGLKAGDLIVSADGQSLAGLSLDKAVSLIRGREGSTVQIRVLQKAGTIDLSVTRRAISEPTVTSKALGGGIGYLDLNSFGENSSPKVLMELDRLKGQGVNRWIVDLRDNGGGYLSSAMDIAGYFIGPKVVFTTKDYTGKVFEYMAPDHGFTLSDPVIFLINQNSASASEILTAAVKDYNEATVVGTTTFGKGTVQSMYPLSNGGVLKMTVDRFYSPLGYEINKVGVKPDVEIKQADSLRVAELMLLDKAEALVKARTADYWEAWGELANLVAVNSPAEPYALYYSNYRKVSELSTVPLDKKFTVHFAGAVDWQSVNSESLELINSETGERTPSTFKPLGPSELQVIPTVNLDPNTTYWLVIHPSVYDVNGQAMSEGAVAVAHTQ